MNAIQSCLSSKQRLGLFESPTGTGKTLSLICALFHWTLNLNEKENQEPEEEKAKESWPISEEDDILQGMAKFVQTAKNAQPQAQLGGANSILGKKRVYTEISLSDVRQARLNADKRKKLLPKSSQADNQNSTLDQDDLTLAYDSTEEEKARPHRSRHSDANRNSGALITLKELERQRELKAEEKERELEFEEKLQVIVCTRTHSQISQFLNELKKNQLR